MNFEDLMSGLVMSALCLVLGLMPGVFNQLTSELRSLSDQLRHGATISADQITEEQRLERPLGLALLGAAIFAFTLVAYALEGI